MEKNMKNKWISILLCVAIVFTMTFAGSVFAYAANIEGVIDLEIPVPVAGANPEKNNITGDNYSGTIDWKVQHRLSEEEIELVDFEGSFKKGEVYCAVVTLTPKEADDVFTDETRITAEAGDACEIELLENGKKLGCYIFFAPTLEKAVKGIEIDTEQVKKDYEVGEKLNTAGLKVTATFEDDDTRLLDANEYDVLYFESALAGEWTLTVLAGGKTKTFTVNVRKALTADDFTFTGNENAITYDGSEKAVTVTSKVGSSVVVAAEDITVYYNGKRDIPKDAGEYKVTFDVAEGPDYKAATGLAAGTLVISPKAISITNATCKDRKYNGTKTVEVTGVTFNGVPEGKSLAIDTDYTATGVMKDIHAYNNKDVTVTVTLKNDNYTLAKNTFETKVNIAKADELTLQDINIKAKAGTAQTLTMEWIELIKGVPTDDIGDLISMTVGEANGDISILDGKAEFVDFEEPAGVFRNFFSVKLNGTGSAGNTVTIPVTLKMSNYEDSILDVVVTLTDKDVPIVTCKNIIKNYDGEAVTVEDCEPAAVFTKDGYTVPVEGSWNFKDSKTPTNVADTGSYIIVFTPIATTYESIEKIIRVTINPVEPSVTATAEEITEAKKLSAVKLTADAIGVKNEKVTGTISWDAPDTNVVQGTAYSWTFTPNSTNYKEVKGSATPWKASTSIGGGGIVPPATDPLPAAKTESTNAVQNYVKPAEYEAAEAAEIKAIMDKAAADIKNAKTEEEVKAIEAAAKAEIDKLETAEEKAVIRTVEATKFKAVSKVTKLNGKKAIKITWNVPADMEFDGFEVYRSTKKNSGFGKKPIFTTTKRQYTNSKGLKKGKTYYYKVRAYKYVNDEKVYTEYSFKAIRTVK